MNIQGQFHLSDFLEKQTNYGIMYSANTERRRGDVKTNNGPMRIIFKD